MNGAWIVLVALAVLAAWWWWNRLPPVDAKALVRPLAEDWPERTLPLLGAVNVRDVGGYRTGDGRRVKTGQVYRAGSLANLTEADQRLLAEKDIRFICDLRTAEEIAEAPDRLPPELQAAYQHLPLTEKDADRERRSRLLALFFNRRSLPRLMTDFYVRVMIEENAAFYGGILRRLADPANRPALIHCTAGKDRTGVAAALLLLALGVPEATITADYSQSNRYYETFLAVGSKAVAPLARFGIKGEDIQPLLVAHPRNIEAVFAHIQQRYGSAEAYFTRSAGLDSATLARLRAELLE